MTKDVLFGDESRKKILIGVQKITDAVRITMGSNGKCCLIGNAIYGNDGLVHLPTIVTKDGYTVTKHFELPDAIENRGAMMIKEAAMKTVEMAGDATTCTCVLAESLITNGMKLIEQGANSQQLKKGMDKAAEYVIEGLKKMSIPIKGDIEKIRQIASVSANNDRSIGDLIAEAYKEIGDEGAIEIEASSGINTEVKITEGYNFERGWISPFFITNRANEVCEFENPLILLYEKKITHHTQVEGAMVISNAQKKPLLIICEDAEGTGLGYLAVNTQEGRFRACVVKSPEFGDLRREYMEDIALVTGATYISSSKGIDIKKVTLDMLGKADKAIISKKETIIRGGKGSEAKFEDFVNDLRMNLAQAKSEEEKFPIEKRIARLTGGIALIQVGAATETELKEKMDRVDDAVRATKAAISEGFVCGGGAAFIKISETGSPVVGYVVGDILKGDYLLHDILINPLKQICLNAGKTEDEANEIVKLIKSRYDNGEENIGYNALTDKIENMVESGIIDSTKALRAALMNAVSVAGMVLTSECSIITVS